MPINRILLFTLSACPMGRSMRNVLEELKKDFPNLMLQTYFIDVDIDQTNQFRIKKNPTTLFVGEDDQELHRLEEFKEKEEIINIVDQINSQVQKSIELFEENQETIEKYTIYLFDKDSLIPVEMTYRNMTSVKSPRITVINLLLKGNLEGFQNPFPLDTQLELVQFNGNKGNITMKFTKEVKEQDMIKMKLALKRTLSPFGISEVCIDKKI